MIAFLLIIGLTGCSSDDPVKPPETDPPPVFTTFTVGADQYLNNRFFFLDLPQAEVSGRQPGEHILLSSLKVFRRMPPGEAHEYDIRNVAAYIDSNGVHAWGQTDFSDPFEYDALWRYVWDFDVILDEQGNLENIDMKSSLLDEDILAVVYSVVDSQGDLIARVGDDPAHGMPPEQLLPGEGATLFYRMKMLKASANHSDVNLFHRVRRNIYSLGGMHFDYESFDLKIEFTGAAENAEMATDTIAWVRPFGLDRETPDRQWGADGIVDKHDRKLFDLANGLLKFPLDTPHPFASDPYQYMYYIQGDAEEEELQTLWDNLAPQIYDPSVAPQDYELYRFFNITSSHRQYETPDN